MPAAVVAPGHRGLKTRCGHADPLAWRILKPTPALQPLSPHPSLCSQKVPTPCAQAFLPTAGRTLATVGYNGMVWTDWTDLGGKANPELPQKLTAGGGCSRRSQECRSKKPLSGFGAGGELTVPAGQ